jgi:hypothetical protein
LEDGARAADTRLGDSAQGRVLLQQRVLPLLRTLLSADGSVWGKSADKSSFSSPTALTATRDISDEHAGEFIFRLWNGQGAEERLPILDLLARLSDPEPASEEMDDLTAVIAPLVDRPNTAPRPSWKAQELADGTQATAAVLSLRAAAVDLHGYEQALRPNPIASLQRIVLLGSLSLFRHAATRQCEASGAPPPILLVDASGKRSSSIAAASQALVTRLMEQAQAYIRSLTVDMLGGLGQDRASLAERLVEILGVRSEEASVALDGLIEEVSGDAASDAGDFAEAIAGRLVEEVDSEGGRNLDGFLRLLGIRCGLLYPIQKVPHKRVVPTDRTLEVLVASSFDCSGPPLEYRHFLDMLHERWGLIVGGRLEDGRLLERRHRLTASDLKDNSERFLDRLVNLGLAQRLADSVAIVGRVESNHG